MSIRLNGSTSGYTEIDAPAVAGSNTLVLPTGNGSANQRLITSGSGTLSWSSDVMLASGSASAPSLYVSGSTGSGMWSPAADTLAWSTAATERMRIGSDGRVSINSTDASAAYFDGIFRVKNNGLCIASRQTGSAGQATYVGWHEATSGDNQFCIFGTEASIAVRGSITYNRGGGVVAYNTTSDYRSKTILGPIENSGAVIDAFRVYKGVMNGATVERPMLVAHEAQEVAPYCVTGEKDAVDENGNPIYQQMDHQVLVPLLIAEIQQLRARVAALESA